MSIITPVGYSNIDFTSKSEIIKYVNHGLNVCDLCYIEYSEKIMLLNDQIKLLKIKSDINKDLLNTSLSFMEALKYLKSGMAAYNNYGYSYHGNIYIEIAELLKVSMISFKNSNAENISIMRDNRSYLYKSGEYFKMQVIGKTLIKDSDKRDEIQHYNKSAIPPMSKSNIIRENMNANYNDYYNKKEILTTLYSDSIEDILQSYYDLAIRKDQFSTLRAHPQLMNHVINIMKFMFSNELNENENKIKIEDIDKILDSKNAYDTKATFIDGFLTIADGKISFIKNDLKKISSDMYSHNQLISQMKDKITKNYTRLYEISDQIADSILLK